MKRTSTFVMIVALVMATSAATTGSALEDDLKFDEYLMAELDNNPVDVQVIITTIGGSSGAVEHVASLGGLVGWEYELIDGFTATVPTAVLEQVASHPSVEMIWLDRPTAPLMDVSHQAIGANTAWAAGVTGDGITVAVLDTGINHLHAYFSGAIVSCVSTIYILAVGECTDTDGHGSHVAGTVASRSNVNPGIAPDASLAVVRVLHAGGAGTTGDIIMGMEWVANNQGNVNPPIRVATMSIGYLNPGCGNGLDPAGRAADRLVASGVTFIVAAGNSGHSTCTIDGASAAHDVITVGAVDDRGTVTQSDDRIASFSSGGPTSDGRLKPDVVFPGVAITSAYAPLPTTATISGTSMAAPHAAGTAALLLENDPSLSPADVKSLITGTAIGNSHTGSLPNNVYGHGLGNACLALQLTTC